MTRRTWAVTAPAALGVIALGLLIAVGATEGLGPILVAAAVLIAAFVLGLRDWRASVRWGVYYLPFSGLLPLAMYPNTAPGVLAKDALFIAPALLGALVGALSRRERLAVPGLPVLLGGLFIVLVLVQMFNPAVPRPLMALIGAKVWLFTPALLILGYHLFDSRASLQRFLKVTLVLAMVPCFIGIAEAAVVAAGRPDRIYALYGAAAAAATQDFTAFQFGGGSLTRLPSIFTFISQYWLFSTATIALGYAAWRGNRSDPFMRWFGPFAITVATLASLTAGARAAFIFSPLLLALIAILEGVGLRRLIGYAIAAVALVIGSTALLQIEFGALAQNSSVHSSFILSLFGDGLHFGLQHALTGLGTGVDTNAGRYAFDTTDYGVVYQTVGGVWWESWYLKALLELGIAGLVLLALLIAALLRRSLQHHRLLRDPELRSMSAAFIALYVWTAIYAIKTAYIDVDPLAYYVWLLVGVQWRLVTLVRDESGFAARSPAVGAASRRTPGATRPVVAAR